MTPFASVAMLEKLALLKIALCRAPAFRSTSSACLRKVTSPARSKTPILVLVASFPLAMVLPPVTAVSGSRLRCEAGAHCSPGARRSRWLALRIDRGRLEMQNVAHDVIRRECRLHQTNQGQ